jgi:hypothetical protein
MARPLIKLGSAGPDVLDAVLRLNLAGADPQLAPIEIFDASADMQRRTSKHGTASKSTARLALTRGPSSTSWMVAGC